MSATPMPNKLLTLQILRAIAALSVVYCHLHIPGMEVGRFGVDVFFVISGFIMAYICHSDAQQFLLRRIIRIVPMYWLFTLGLFGVALVAPQVLQASTADIIPLLKSLFFIPYMKSNDHIHPLLAVGWTLNYEMMFYLWLAVCLLLVPARRAPLLCSAILLVQVAVLNQMNQEWVLVKFYGDPIIIEFVFGIVAYYLVVRGRGFTGLPLPLLYALGLAAMVSMAYADAFEYVGATRFIFIGLPALLLLLCIVALEGRVNERSRLVRLMVALGDASYVMYLMHFYIIQGLRMVVAKFVPALSPVEPAGAVLAVVTVIVISLIMHYRLEKPVTGYLRKATSSRS